MENVPCPLVIVGDIHITDAFICRSNESGKPVDTFVHSPGSSELMSEGEGDKKYVLEINTDTCNVRKVQIETREVMRLEVRTDEDVEQTIGLIKKQEDKSPLVFLKFDTSLENVISRIRRALHGTEVILRPKPIMEYNGKEIEASTDNLDITLQEVLQEILPVNSPVFTPVSQLLDSEADVVTVLDNFVDKRMEELDNVNT
jgi:hypothetical protein